MPIGFDPGDVGGAREVRLTVRDVLAEVGRGLWSWVAVLRQEVTPVVWTRWQTAEDERVCPECAPLDGLVWPEGEGPAPPLHPSCRCQRSFAFTEWRVREQTDWQLLQSIDGGD